MFGHWIFESGNCEAKKGEKIMSSSVLAVKKKLGRPCGYTDAMAAEVCEVVAITTYSIEQMCKERDHWPSIESIKRWRFKYPEFGAAYVRAKVFQAELLAEELLKVSSEKAYYTDQFGNQRVDSGFVQSQRLLADSIKWQASKLAQNIYGDKTQTESVVTVKHEELLKDLK